MTMRFDLYIPDRHDQKVQRSQEVLRPRLTSLTAELFPTIEDLMTRHRARIF